jgi:phosphate transport system permease protein
LFVFTDMREPINQAIDRAFGAAVVLLVLVVVLFSLARILGGREPGHISRRQQRRLSQQRRARARRLESEPVR